MSRTLLCEAIRNETMVTFAYKGERFSVEPWSVGYDRQNKQENPLLLRAWYLDGWRDFEVKFMSSLEAQTDPAPSDRLSLRVMAIVLCSRLPRRDEGFD